MKKGLVSLIGAGPGDPELLTLKALRRLREADLVLHDALVPAEVIALAGSARAFDVGKRARRKSTPQETIHRIMIHAALRGERVARLKGGDPFVLGRGGEEALALAAARIPFEVIPGVSSAIAAPALAGIPVTHRGIASGFLVVSGHSPDSYRSLLASALPNSATVVVLMGLAHRAAVAELLLDCGWRSDTPAALVLAASTPGAASFVSRLDQIGRIPLPPTEAPGTIVIGDVVSLSDRMAIAQHFHPVVEKGVPA